jgi:hypothetical protein
MPDNFEEKLDQIKNMLQDEKIANKLSSFLDSLNDSNNNTSSKEFDTEFDEDELINSTPPPPIQNSSFNQSMSNNIDTLNRITKIYNTINDTNTPSVNLLMAIKPFLNSRRQGHLDNAARVLNFSKLPNMVKDIDKE